MVNQHRRHLGPGEDLNKQNRSARGTKDNPAVLKELADAQGKTTKIIASVVKADKEDNQK
jgi:hypothetical protein